MLTSHNTQVGFYAGHIPSVAVYDYEIARELFSRDVAAGRPNTFVWMYRCDIECRYCT